MSKNRVPTYRDRSPNVTISLVPVNPLPTTRTLLLLLVAFQNVTQTSAPTTIPLKALRKPKVHKATQSFNPNLVVLDAGHGGGDHGGVLPNGVLEKDVTVAFAAQLQGILTGRGFSVVLTHSSASDEVTPDARVELANRSHAVACILLHATGGGHGVHLYTSALTATTPAENTIIPWGAAQASSVPQSLQLAGELATALNGLHVPMVVGRVSVQPIDSLTCPAVAVEIAPARDAVTDPAYQQQVAQGIAAALTFWREHAQARLAAMDASTANKPAVGPTQPASSKPKPKPAVKPVIIHAPDETPLVPDITPKASPGASPQELRP